MTIAPHRISKRQFLAEGGKLYQDETIMSNGDFTGTWKLSIRHKQKGKSMLRTTSYWIERIF